MMYLDIIKSVVGNRNVKSVPKGVDLTYSVSGRYMHVTHMVYRSCQILSFRRKVDENCPLKDYFAGRSGNSLPTFRENYCSHLQGSSIQDQVF